MRGNVKNKGTKPVAHEIPDKSGELSEEDISIAWLLSEEQDDEEWLSEDTTPDTCDYGFSPSGYARMPLLSREKEIELLRRISEGNQAVKQLRLSQSEEDKRALEQKIEAGKEALSELVTANVGLVCYTIANFLRPEMARDEDLIQEGIIGIIAAAMQYSPESGTKFATYAVYWIKQSIFNAMRTQARLVRLSRRAEERVAQIYRTRQVLTQRLGREPTISEISDQTGIPPRRIRELIGFSLPPLRLDAPIGNYEEDDDLSLGDVIPSQSPDPADEIADREMRLFVRKAVDQLPEQEREIICGLYGFDRDYPQTFAEMGRERNVSKETIRQRAKRAMARLQHPRVRRMLADFL